MIHGENCDVVRCTVCGLQLMGHDDPCAGHDPWEARWRGEYPGVLEARERGWWACLTARGWQPCPAGTDGAVEDLNRWVYFTQTGVDGLYDR